MKTDKRLSELRALRRPRMAEEGFPTREDFVNWLGRVGPLLNFSDSYYNAFQQAVPEIQVRGLSTARYEHLLSHIDSIIAQAITELEFGITPKKDIVLDDKHGVWWFFSNCSAKTRLWIISVSFIIISTIASACYFAGRSDFLNQVFDAWTKSQNANPQKK